MEGHKQPIPFPLPSHSICRSRSEFWHVVRPRVKGLVMRWLIRNILYLLYQNSLAQNMQLKFQETNLLGSTKLLQKCTSMPSFTDTNHSSNNSIDSLDDQYRKYAIRWILSYNKKISKDTQYLAISYLNRLNRKSFTLTDQNHEKTALALLLLASKMNEIYPPKITSMASKCKRPIPQEEVIAFEGAILNALDFEMALDNNAYTHMHSILGCLYSDKLQQCEKLLRMVAPHRQIYQFGEEILAYAIIYLIIPDFIRKMKLRESQKIKTLAIKIYTIYTETKEKYDREKENRNRT